MTAQEFKNEIIKAIDNVPQSSLPKILDFINSIEPYPQGKDMNDIIDYIIKDEGKLLKRLAE